MKVCFFGTPEIAVPSLEALAQNKNIEIVGVGVFPDKKVGRKKILTPCPVKASAQKLNLPIFEVSNKKELVSLYQKLDFDIAIVIAFGVIFPKKILDKPKFGTVNVHFSLLPEYRGASPVQSAILDGKDISGITFQKMVKRLDAGDILFQKQYNIKNQTTLQLWKNFAEITAQELPEFLEGLKNSKITPKPQDKNFITYCSKFEKSDGEVFPEKEPAQTIYQKFLAFTPWPGIFLKTSKGNLKILDLEIPSSPPDIGDLGDSDSGLNLDLLECTENTFLKIKIAQIPGKKPMKMEDILKGNPDILNSRSDRA